MLATRTTTYPAFGSPMPTRVWSDPNSKYKYGFNGKEKDDDINVNGGSYDFGARIYDSRLGRWLSLDPLANKYSDLNPYNFCNNNAVVNIDCNGKDFKLNIFIDSDGKPQLEVICDIYTISEETTAEINAAAAQWTALNGTKVKFNDVEFNVTFKINVSQKASLEEAKIACTGNPKSNVYGGNIKEDGTKAETNQNITLKEDGTWDEITTTAAVTSHTSYVYYYINTINKIVPENLSEKFGIPSGTTSVITKGNSPICLAHELGHLLLLTHNANYNGGQELKEPLVRTTAFDPKGVMVDNCVNSPSKSDLINALSEAINYYDNAYRKIDISEDARKKIFPSWDGKEENKPKLKTATISQ